MTGLLPSESGDVQFVALATSLSSAGSVLSETQAFPRWDSWEDN
jgi:hypothetical protein